jgi:predicted outer membrane protein
MSIRPRTIPALIAAAAVATGAGAATAPAAPSHGSSGSSKSATARKYAADRHWLKAIVQNDFAEISTGNVAQQKGTTPAVKELGAMLVADHTKHLAKTRTLARSLKLTLPKGPNPLQLWVSATLDTMVGPAFDSGWLTAQIGAHQTAISQTQDEISDGTHPAVRNFAKATLPTLQMHLQMATKAAGGPA